MVDQHLRVLLEYLVAVVEAVEEFQLLLFLVPAGLVEEEQFFQAEPAVVVPHQQLVQDLLL